MILSVKGLTAPTSMSYQMIYTSDSDQKFPIKSSQLKLNVETIQSIFLYEFLRFATPGFSYSTSLRKKIPMNFNN